MSVCTICSAENPEQALVCTECGANLLRQSPSEGLAAAAPGSPAPHRPVLQPPGERRASSRSLGLGLVFTLSTLAIFFLTGLVWPRAYEIAFQRGWIPYAIMILFGWSMAILWKKRQALSKQRRLSVRKLLASYEQITPEDVGGALGAIQKHYRGEEVAPHNDHLVRRLWRALETFEAQRRVGAAGEALQHASEVDASTVDASYSLVRVFIWAIPILGFIGTVMGIGDAVHGFSSFIQGVEEISRLREELTPALGGVSSGLAVAFDTTLLALLLSIPTMVLASHSQKREEEWLNEVDTESFTLLDRLHEPEAGGGIGMDPASLGLLLTNLTDRMLALVEKSLEGHSQKLDALARASLDRYQELLTTLLKGPVGTLEKGLEETRQAARELGEDLSAALDRSEKTADRLAAEQVGMNGRLEQLGAVSRELAATGLQFNEVAGALAGQHGAFTSAGDSWLDAFNGSKTELLGALEDSRNGLEEARRWLKQPRPIRLKAIELMEEAQLGEE